MGAFDERRTESTSPDRRVPIFAKGGEPQARQSNLQTLLWTFRGWAFLQPGCWRVPTTSAAVLGAAVISRSLTRNQRQTCWGYGSQWEE